MQRFVISTNDVPEAERFSYWREEVCERLFGFSWEPDKNPETPYRAEVVASSSASLRVLRLRSIGCLVVRGPREIARVGHVDCFWIYREGSVGARFDYSRREIITQPGDLVIGDPAVPFTQAALANYNHETLIFPRKLLERHLSPSTLPASLVLTGTGGVAGMVKAYLDAFAAQMDSLDDRETGLITENFCRLLAVACGAAAGEHQEAIRLARLEEAKRYIDRHLADPGLTPEKAAGALKMSVRQLHLMFEPSGTSFAQHVLKRRLEECRTVLTSPAGGRSVTDIALAFGFSSLWTFNRTFRRAFGVTPSEARGRAAAPRPNG
jgi:AraC-like DNA-binding protein